MSVKLHNSRKIYLIAVVNEYAWVTVLESDISGN